MRRIETGAGICALCAAALAAVAHGQTDLERFERQLEQFRRDTQARVDQALPPGQRALVKYGGYLTLDYLSLDDPAGRNHVLRQAELVGYGRLNLDGVHDLFFRGRAGYQDFAPGDSFDGRGDDWIDPRVERAFYRFDLQRYRDLGGAEPSNLTASFQLGRDLIYWANGLVLSQVLDGAVVDLGYGPVDLRLVAGVTDRDVVDFDASRPDFVDDTRRGFYGAMLGARAGPHRPFVYFLSQQDYNEDETVVLTSPAAGRVETAFDYQSYYVGVGAAGAIGDRLAYGAELVYEGGAGLSNSVALGPAGEPLGQTEEPINAFAADLRLDYLFADPRDTRLSAEVILATGDADRLHTSNTIGGNRPGTDDEAFNAFGLLNTGLAFNPPPSNLAMVRVGFSTTPFPEVAALRRLQVGADLFVFNKLRANAPIDEPTDDGRYLGFEPDLFLNWRITSDVTLAVRYGVFFPGEAILSDDQPRQVFFTGVTFAF